MLRQHIISLENKNILIDYDNDNSNDKYNIFIQLKNFFIYIELPLPLRKSNSFGKIEVVFYHGEMHRSYFFPNIYDF